MYFITLLHHDELVLPNQGRTTIIATQLHESKYNWYKNTHPNIIGFEYPCDQVDNCVSM